MIDYFFFFLLFTFTTLYFLRKPTERKTASVLVQGDVGRSPRMQYHVLSLLNRGYMVNFLGYAEASVIKEIQLFKTFNLVPLGVPPSRSHSRASFVIKVSIIFKIIYSLNYN